MTFTFEDRSISSVAVLDDNEDSRETMSDELRHASFTPAPIGRHDADKESLIDTITGAANAAVCDHHLLGYAPCSGAEAVSGLYEVEFPAVLVTAYFKADIDQIRPFRRGIPTLLTPDEASEDPDSIVRGFELCIREFREDFSPTRRPWRTMLRVDDVEEFHGVPMVYIVLPGWNSSEVIRFPRSMIPEELHSFVQPGERFFATVNKGAEDQLELYFENFEHRRR